MRWTRNEVSMVAKSYEAAVAFLKKYDNFVSINNSNSTNHPEENNKKNDDDEKEEDDVHVEKTHNNDSSSGDGTTASTSTLTSTSCCCSSSSIGGDDRSSGSILLECDPLGYLPLHLICWFKPSIDVIILFVQHAPSSIYVENKIEHWLPIHIACRNNAHYDVIQYLIEKYPDSLCKVDTDGNLPIHCGLKNGGFLQQPQPQPQQSQQQRSSSSSRLVDTIRLLVDVYPQCLSIPDARGLLPLHCIFETLYFSYTKIVQFLIRSYPLALMKPNNLGKLPIHCAICSIGKREVPMNLLQYMIYNAPMSLLTADNDGKIPLHHACNNPSNIIAIQLLVEQYQDGLQRLDKQGHYPIYYALGEQYTTIQYLLDICPQQLKQIDNHGRTLLHFAINRAVPIRMIKFLIEHKHHHHNSNNHHNNHDHDNKTAAALYMTDRYGKLPIHHASYYRRSIEYIHCLLHYYPNSCKQMDHYGKLPIHYAVDNTGRSSIECIHYLIDKYPYGLSIPDSTGFLPFHIAAMTDRSIDIIYDLIQREPMLIFYYYNQHQTNQDHHNNNNHNRRRRRATTQGDVTHQGI